MPNQSPADQVPALTPVLDFLRALWHLNHRLEVASSEMLRTHGVTAQQRMLLRVVQQLQPVSAGVLAAALHVHAGTLSASLRRLEQRGLLRRQRDAADGRRVTVTLSPTGLELIGVTKGTVEACVAEVLECVSADATATTLEMLGRISESLPGRTPAHEDDHTAT